MSASILAGRLDYATRTFAIKEQAIPEPGPGEVRVRVRAAGICLSDVHLISGEVTPLYRERPEVTLGHEVAGEVDLLGDGVVGVAAGDRVIVGPVHVVDGSS